MIKIFKFLLLVVSVMFLSLNIAYYKYYEDLSSLSIGKSMADDDILQRNSKLLHPYDFLLNNRLKYDILNALRCKDSGSVALLKKELWNLDSHNFHTIHLYDKYKLR